MKKMASFSRQRTFALGLSVLSRIFHLKGQRKVHRHSVMVTLSQPILYTSFGASISMRTWQERRLVSTLQIPYDPLTRVDKEQLLFFLSIQNHQVYTRGCSFVFYSYKESTSRQSSPGKLDFILLNARLKLMKRRCFFSIGAQCPVDQ
ncbi:hypothetical protein ACROYT_G042192 [Oculina patagonica]